MLLKTRANPSFLVYFLLLLTSFARFMHLANPIWHPQSQQVCYFIWKITYTAAETSRDEHLQSGEEKTYVDAKELELPDVHTREAINSHGTPHRTTRSSVA